MKAARALAKALTALGTARAILRRRRPDAVLGGGGYVAGPVGLAAVRTAVPLVLSEADSHLGLANRLLARRARRICLAFPIKGREGERYLVTGRPVPEAVVEADRGIARRRFGLSDTDRCVTVVGGSLGARSINLAAFEAFGTVAGRGETAPARVIHVAGRRDFAELQERWRGAGSPGRYTLLEYEPTLADVLAAADLVIARAGGSVMEIAAAGRPAILIPYPHATGGHQTTNARWLAEGGAALVLPERKLSAERLRTDTDALLADGRRLGEMAAASKRLARPDAARRLADLVEEVAGAG